MSELSPIAGKTRKVTIRNREYTVSPLDIDDLAEFETIVRMERNKALLKSLGDSGLQNELIAEAIGVTAAKPISLADIEKNMSSMMGVRFLLWCALRKNHPELKLEKMGKLIDLDNLEEATNIVSDLGGKAVKKGKNVTRGKK